MARVDTTFLSKDTFASTGANAATVRGLKEKMGYEVMTKVQALTIPYALQGLDIVAKAQTGTGKTIAFLVPIINRAAARGSNGSLSALVLSPTRELAMQIHTEASHMLTFHSGLSAHVVVGGTNIGKDVKLLVKVDILVATPGRLIDHIQNTPGFAARLKNLDTFALDEADRMLDMGFRPDLERIVAATGGPQKQTLLFSATIAPEVIELAPKLLSQQFMFIDAGTGRTALATTAAGSKDGAMRLVADDPFVTAKQVTQEVAIVEQSNQVQAVVDVLLRERQVPGHKVMVFFTTARCTQLFAELFHALGCPVLEIHSRKSQSHRQKTSDSFRDGTNMMMFSSDVTARGMDYPDVSLVLQVGLPSSGEQYVHRLGRTGRAGMKGRGLLLLMPEEKFFLKQIEQLRVTEVKLPASQIPESVVSDAMQRVSADTRAMAYAAWLGFYNSFASKLRWAKDYLVTRANQFATESLGCRSPPALQKKTIGKMGLKGVPGLVIEGTDSERPHSRQVPVSNQGHVRQQAQATAPGAQQRQQPAQVQPQQGRQQVQQQQARQPRQQPPQQQQQQQQQQHQQQAPRRQQQPRQPPGAQLLHQPPQPHAQPQPTRQQQQQQQPLQQPQQRQAPQQHLNARQQPQQQPQRPLPVEQQPPRPQPQPQAQVAGSESVPRGGRRGRGGYSGRGSQ